MKNPKSLVIFGSILIMIGALMPWATISSTFLGISKSVYGFETLGLLTGLAGLIFFFVALATQQKQGKQYSTFVLVTGILIGLVTVFKIIDVLLTQTTSGVKVSIGLGLLCLTPLGILLAIIGASKKLPALPAPPPTPENLQPSDTP